MYGLHETHVYVLYDFEVYDGPFGMHRINDICT